MKKKKLIMGAVICAILATTVISVSAYSYNGSIYTMGDRYCQGYTLSITKNWRYVGNNAGYEGVLKRHNRNYAVQIDSNTQPQYGTCMIVERYGSDFPGASRQCWIYGTGGNDNSYNESGIGARYTLGARSDDRLNGTYQIKGLWSPDMYA